MLTSEEQRLWYLLLSNARTEFYNKNTHQIPVTELLDKWSKNKTIEQLKESLKRLALRINYTSTPQHKKESVFVLLSSAEIYDGICYYSYARKFKEFTHHPKIATYFMRWGLTASIKVPAHIQPHVYINYIR